MTLGADGDRDEAALTRLLLRVVTGYGYQNRRDGAARRYVPLDRPVEAPLSQRQAEVLACAAFGLTAGESGVLLSLEEGTVRDHLAAARRVLAAKTTTHAVAEAIRRGLIP